MVWVIESKIIWKWSEGKQKLLRVSEGASYCESTVQERLHLPSFQDSTMWAVTVNFAILIVTFISLFSRLCRRKLSVKYRELREKQQHSWTRFQGTLLHLHAWPPVVSEPKGTKKNEANKMFIIWLPVWESRKKCRTSDLTVIWQTSENESFNWLTETIAHYRRLSIESRIKMQMRHVEKVYSVKTKSTVNNPLSWCDAGVFWKLDIVFGLKSLPSFFFVGLWKKNCMWQRILSRWSGAGMFVIIFVEGIARFLLDKMSRISASRFSPSWLFTAITVSSNSLESSSSIRLHSVSSLALFANKHRLKCWRMESTSSWQTSYNVL